MAKGEMAKKCKFRRSKGGIASNMARTGQITKKVFIKTDTEISLHD